MSVIIKAKNITFSNADLPVLSPMISNGLVASFRPTNAGLGLIDLSGNGHQLTTQGAPQLTANSAIVDKNNGFVINARETTDLTLIVVSRAVKNPQASGEDQWLGMVVGTYYNDRGSSIFTGYNSTKNEVDTLGQSYAKKTTDGTVSSKTVWLGSQSATTNQTDFKFTALVVKATDNKVLTYAPAKQSTPMFIYDGSTDGYRVDLRNLSDPTTDQPNYFKLGIANVPFGDGKSEIAEVLIYNRALTQDEIMRQYKYSQAFLQKHRNIVI